MELVLVVVLALCLQGHAQHFQYFYTNPVVPFPQFDWQQPQAYNPQITQQARFQPGQDLYQAQVATQLPADNYRGYTYHTTFDDGASSTVVFFRGPLPLQLPVNIQNSTSHRLTIASDSVDSNAGQNDDEDGIAVNLNGGNQHLQSSAILRRPLSLIASMLEHPIQQNGLLHFFYNQVPASTTRLQQPSIQTSESITSEYFAPNSLENSNTKVHFSEHRQDKSFDETAEISTGISNISETPETSTTAGYQVTDSSEAMAIYVNMSPDSHSINMNPMNNNVSISENSKQIEESSTTESKSTYENVPDTTMAESTEESITTTLFEMIESSSSETMITGEPNSKSTSDQSTSAPAVSMTKNAGLANNGTTDDTGNLTSTTTDGNDVENTTKMLIVVL